MSSESSSDTKTVAFRPRILYCSLFLWTTVTCGKFIAPLLQILSPGFSDRVIGATLAVQYGIIACLSGWGGSLADEVERKSVHWGRGRLKVLAGSVLLGTIAFLGHGLPSYVDFVGITSTAVEEATSDDSSARLNFELAWHILMRFIYAIGMAIGAPTIDGLALAQLDNMEGTSREEFGKERMYGALFWGLGSLAVGVGMDHFGVDFLYFMAIFSTISTYIVIGIYIWGLNRDTSGTFEKSNNLASCQSNHQTSGEEEIIPMTALFNMTIRTGYGKVFTLFLLILSVGMSVVDNLAFIFFNFLGSSDSMNGFTVVFTVLMEVPVFYLAPQLLSHLGPGKMLLLAGVAYVVRVLGYTVVPKGHMEIILCLDTFHGISYACQKVGSVEYVARIMPSGYEASGQGILFLVSNLGVVVGLGIGGELQEALGPRVMYGFMGSLVLAGLIALVIAEVLSSLNTPTFVRNGDGNNEQTHLIVQS